MEQASLIPDDDDIDIVALPAPAKRANEKVAQRASFLESRLRSLVAGKARKFTPEPGQTTRGLKLQLSKTVSRLGLQPVLRIDSAMLNGVETVYARFLDGVTGYPETPAPPTEEPVKPARSK